MPSNTRIRGCFDSIEKLRAHHPGVLVRFLQHFPGTLTQFGIVLPVAEGAQADDLPYDKIREALMSPAIPDSLTVLLILIHRLGNENGWREIEHEANLRGLRLDFPKQDLSYADRAMMAWIVAQPTNPDILEESQARVRIHGKSSYTYYSMLKDVRPRYRMPTAAALRALERRLGAHFSDAPELQKGAKVLVFDYDMEIWFLIRYPGMVRRQGVYGRDGKVTTMPITPELYDAVVYNKKYGDLRMNTHRAAEHGCYRMEFGAALFDSANVFHPKQEIIRLTPLLGDCVDLCRVDDVTGLARILVTEVCFFAVSCGARRVTWRAEEDDAMLPFVEGQRNRILPADTDSVLYAKFRYQLKQSGHWRNLTVHTGNTMSYERDGDSCVLEDLLRKRRLIHASI